jgi:hypothetical protein
MAKKHFIQFAAHYKAGLELVNSFETNSECQRAARNQVLREIDCFCTMAKQENSAFNTVKFQAACGVKI